MATAAERDVFSSGLPDQRTAGRSRTVPALATLAVSVLLDLGCIAIGWLFGQQCYLLFHHGGAIPGNPDLAAAFIVEYWLIYIFLARSHHLYDPWPCLLQVRTTENVLRISCFCLIIAYAQLYLLHAVVPRLPLCAGWLVAVILLLSSKHVSRGMLGRVHALSRSGLSGRHILIVGITSDARRIFSYIRNSPHLGVASISFVNEGAPTELEAIYSHDYKHRWHAPVYHCKLTGEFLERMGVSEVFVGDASIPPQRIGELSALLLDREITFSTVGNPLIYQHGQPGIFRSMDGVPVTSYYGVSAPRPIYEAVKRLVDIACALLLLALCLPVALIMAILVSSTSPGPILFRQERIGRRGLPFTILKFRSMYVNAPQYDRSPESSRDQRITPIGRFLRKTSLDELPQLLNVVRGDMALVGPRPEMPYIVAQYSALERRRLSVPQGLTGLWQLSADRKYSIHQSLEYDVYYVDNRGFFLDAAIMVHTLLYAAKGFESKIAYTLVSNDLVSYCPTSLGN